MKGISIVLTVITVMLALSQLICGLWLKSQAITPDSASFHATLGISTIIATLATLVSLWLLAGQRAGQRAKAQVK